MEAHHLPACLSVRDGRLYMDGLHLTSLTRRFGSPLFVFSRQQVEASIKSLLSLNGPDDPPVQVHYACKANSNLGLLRVIRAASLNLEVNSGGELWKGRQAGFTGSQILFNGVAKTDDEVTQALQAGCTLIVDSLAELDRLFGISRRLGKRANILLRLAPHLDSATPECFQTAHSESKFGMEMAEAFRALQESIASEYIDEVGLHLHQGGQIYDVETFHGTVDFIQGFLQEWADTHPASRWKPSTINLGGGLPIRFMHLLATAEQLSEEKRRVVGSELDIAALKRILEPLRRQGHRLALEPGRYIVANAAVLLTQVINQKRRQAGEVWLLLDGGYSMLMDTFTYRWLFELVAPDRINEPHNVAYCVGGPLCDQADVFHAMSDDGYLPRFRCLPDNIKAGDALAFLDVGGYSLEQMNEYNGRLQPAALLIERDGGLRIIRRRQGYEDLCPYDVEEVVESQTSAAE
jgi:diaminopimelate decarboxylase